MTEDIEHIVRTGMQPAAGLEQLTRGVKPEQAFDFWWAITGIGCRSYRLITHGHAEPCAGPVRLTFIDVHRGRVDVDQVPAHDRLAGRWTAAALADDVDTARALWGTVDDVAVGSWFCWQLWLQTLQWVRFRLHREEAQNR